MQKSDDKSPV